VPTAPSTQSKPMTWQYMAGFFDGEGCICVRRNKADDKFCAYCTLAISQRTDRAAVLLEIKEFLEERGIVVKINMSKAHSLSPKEQAEIVVVRRADVLKVLRRMLPYLRVKNDRAIEVIAYLEELLQLRKEFGGKFWMYARPNNPILNPERGLK
jgi:LAGLIDADG endonuclease